MHEDINALPDLVTQDLSTPDSVVPSEEVVGLDVLEDQGGGGQDGLTNDTTEPDTTWEPPEVAPGSEPTLVAVEKWLVTYVKSPDLDTIGPKLDAGTFVPPSAAGVDADGNKWLERIPGEGGTMGYAGYGLFYAVAQVTLDSPGNLMVRADRFYQTWINGTPQPGDPYATGAHRLPGTGVVGNNVVVAMAYMAVNDPVVQVFETPDEVYFNLADTTLPDLVVGEQAESWAGVAFLNLTDHSLGRLNAKVIESEHFAASEVSYPSLGPTALTQLAFKLVPKGAPTAAGETWEARIHVESPDLAWCYEAVVGIPTVAARSTYRHTRRSLVDHSVQYAGINPPSGPKPDTGYSLVLSLHGAGVQGIGQAQAYSQKEWAYLVAPTNRRPFGFDWEEWGRLDGMEALDDAMATFSIDPTRVYVTGHSMGGHGTWQFGVLFPNRFRVVGPSAGWSSFYSYGGATEPTGPFARARASSFTLSYVSNLANRAVYMIHGDADDNVPISEANLMAAAVEPVADEFYFHVQPGAGHWWDGDASPGADCVDWPELFTWMQERTLKLTEVEFHFRTPSPWVTDTYSYVTVRSQLDPNADSEVTSETEGSAVTLTTQNVRSMMLDGAALKAAGYGSLRVDGVDVALADGPIPWGPQEGKNPHVQGPMNQVYHRPFCFVYPDETNTLARRYVSFLISSWNVTGNGHACALPYDEVTDEIRSAYNMIYVDLAADQVPVPAEIPFAWDDASVTLGTHQIPGGTLLFVFPEEGHLSAALVASGGSEPLLFWNQPWSSRSGLPDWVGWTAQGVYGAGFFDGDWVFKEELGVGLE